MKAPHHENRKRDVRRAARPCDQIGGRRHLADVELDVAYHPTERRDDRNNFDEVRLDALDQNRPVLDRRRVPRRGDGNLQRHFHIHCFSSPAFWITAPHFSMSARMRACISSGVVPRASRPNCSALAWMSGDFSASLISLLRNRTISSGVPAGAETAFQLVTT